jgi:hypothetical protein
MTSSPGVKSVATRSAEVSVRRRFVAMGTLILLAGAGANANADPAPSTQPSAQVTRGIRMRLVPPKVPIEQSQDPLSTITDQMSGVTDQIAELNTGRGVQGQQTEIVGNLDAVIKMLQQKSGNGNSGSRNPTKPMNDSRIAGGPGGIGPLVTPTADSRNFANLTPKDRDAILQSKTEGFPPGYESLLQSYYQRLAEDKAPAKSSGDTAEPTGTAP